MLALLIGFLNWVTREGLESFVTVWSMIFVVFVMVMIIATYVGGYSRIKEEKRLIVEAQRREEEMKQQKNKKK
jgi:uncharacterized membrane protein